MSAPTPKELAIEALRPFAALGAQIDARRMASPKVAKPDTALLSIGGKAIRTVDLYRARAALDALTGPADTA